MGVTNFDGLQIAGITTVGMGILPGGNTWFVNSTGTSGDGTTITAPLLTIAAALAKCKADHNDYIIVGPQHAETISAAAGLNINVAGVTIIGLGNGSDRPTLTFASSTAATCTITAANVKIFNIVGTTTVDQIVSPFVVSAAGCNLSIEWQDGSSILESVRAILTTAAADNLTVNLTYRGFPAGSHTVNGVRLVGCNDGRINVDFYGKASTAVVEFLTTACTNIIVTGNMYTSGTTDQSKLVVDTATGSKWFAYGYDATADAGFVGGDAVAIAVAPSTTAITNALYSTGVASWPTAAAYANSVTLAAVLGYIQDGVRRGSGTIMAANKSVADALGTDGATVTDSAVTVLGAVGANNADNAFSSASVVVNNDGSVLERLEGILDASWRLATANSTSALTTGTIFTFTKSIEFKIVGRVTTAIQAQATTVKLGVVSDAFALYDIDGTLDINGFTAGSLIGITGTAAGGATGTTSVGALAPFQTNSVVATCVTSGVIRATFGAASTGAIKWLMIWRPLETGATVV